MTTQNTPSLPEEGEQGSHYWIITLELPDRVAATQSGTCTPAPGWTRHDMYRAIRRDLISECPKLGNATVAFFSLEPNQF
ncbi:hypothetical protein AB0D29_02020 [Streptomyces sp. NPDC048424]|uniref:hypothetical protein n=1 Tax=Streptomyces sp. NPDC048424 TaxID=3155265 RepID=UPI003430B0C9